MDSRFISKARLTSALMVIGNKTGFVQEKTPHKAGLNVIEKDLA